METLARFQRWRDANLDNPIGYPYVASMEAMAGGAFWRMQRYTEARQHFEAALSILHGPHGMQSNELAINYLAMANVDFSMMLVDIKNYQEALPHAKEAFLVASKRLAAQPQDPGWQSVTGFSQVALGRSMIFNGHAQEGARLLEGGLARLRDLYKGDQSDAEAAAAVMLCDLWAMDAAHAIHLDSLVKQLGAEVTELAEDALRHDPIDASAKRSLYEARKVIEMAQLRH